jgi:hypothetical protein
MKARLVGIGLIAALAAVLAYAIIYAGPIDVTTIQDDPFEGWIRSGPFGINKGEYKIDENIFVIAKDLKPHEFGNMVFVMPNGTTRYITIPFDGSDKSSFNQYFKPAVSANRKICSTNDLVGEWTVTFQGTNYKPIHFNIVNQTLDNNDTRFRKVC